MINRYTNSQHAALVWCLHTDVSFKRNIVVYIHQILLACISALTKNKYQPWFIEDKKKFYRTLLVPWAAHWRFWVAICDQRIQPQFSALSASYGATGIICHLQFALLWKFFASKDLGGVTSLFGLTPSPSSHIVRILSYTPPHLGEWHTLCLAPCTILNNIQDFGRFSNFISGQGQVYAHWDWGAGEG